MQPGFFVLRLSISAFLVDMMRFNHLDSLVTRLIRFQLFLNLLFALVLSILALFLKLNFALSNFNFLIWVDSKFKLIRS